MDSSFGKILILLGIVLIASGLALLVFKKIPFLGNLPGDIRIEKGNFTFYFPLVSCLLVSAILSLIFKLFK